MNSLRDIQVGPLVWAAFFCGLIGCSAPSTPDHSEFFRQSEWSDKSVLLKIDARIPVEKWMTWARFAGGCLSSLLLIVIAAPLSRLLRPTRFAGKKTVYLGRGADTYSRIDHLAYIRRWHYGLVACLSAAGLIYGSLLPFRFREQSLSDAWQFFQTLWTGEGEYIVSSQDMAINVLIAVPLAFALIGTLLFRCRHPLAVVLAFVVTISACIALSVFVEFAQLWLDSRVSSPLDVAAQLTGAVIGIVLWLLIGPELTDWLDDFIRSREPATRIEYLLHAYVVGLMLWSLLPFDLTASLDQIFRKYESGHIEVIPFTFPFESPFKFWYALIVHSLLFVPVGIWSATTWLRRSEKLRNVWAALAVCITANLMLELSQLFIKSRYTSSTDVICATLGTALGIFGAHLWKRRLGDSKTDTDHSVTGKSGFWTVLSVAYSVVLLAVFWAPFELTRHEKVIREQAHRFVDIPFRILQSSGSDVGAMFQVLHNFGWFIPLGVLTALAIDRVASTTRVRAVLSVAAAVFIAMTALVIEVGQVLMPDKTADLTEVMIFWAGGLAGLLIATAVLRRWSP